MRGLGDLSGGSGVGGDGIWDGLGDKSARVATGARRSPITQPTRKRAPIIDRPINNVPIHKPRHARTSPKGAKFSLSVSSVTFPTSIPPTNTVVLEGSSPPSPVPEATELAGVLCVCVFVYPCLPAFLLSINAKVEQWINHSLF